MLNEKKLFNILMTQNIPLITHLLETISKDYDIDIDELKGKYLSQFKKKKKIKTKKRRITGYTLFLKDNDLNAQLQDKYKTEGFKNISKIKGEIWKSMSQNDKNVYIDEAKKITEENE